MTWYAPWWAGTGRPGRRRSKHTPGEVVLRVERLTREGAFTDVSFEVRAGEIVAFAGLVGSGRSEVARAIFGIDDYDAGSVIVRDRPLRWLRPRPARWPPGWASCPRTGASRAWSWTCRCSRTWRWRRWAGFAGRRDLLRSRSATSPPTGPLRLRIKFGRLTDPVSQLSGGNQQKVVLAKWLGRQPSLLIVDEPTPASTSPPRQKCTACCHSSRKRGRDPDDLLELPEVLRVGDRVLVMREGRLVAEYSRSDASEETI